MEKQVKLAKAIIAVMKEVKGIDKSMAVGTGKMQYKGVPDQEVKKIVGSAMEKNGLAMLPIDIEEETQVDRWEQTDQWGTKQKQSIFTKVKVKYLLLHESGESLEIAGYGHGIDSQDKGAGKATTYAMKYALLYTFLVPTGKIDDSDNTHSESIETPKVEKPKPVKPQKVKLDTERFDNALKQIEDGKYSIDLLRVTFLLDVDQEKIVQDLEDELKAESETIKNETVTTDEKGK